MAIPTLNTADPGDVLITPEVAKELLMMVRDAGCVEKFAAHTPMKKNSKELRKQTEGVQGYWVDNLGMKPVDRPDFDKETLLAKKMAVIVILEDEFEEDADYDMASVVNDDVVAGFAESLDSTFMGYDPTSPFADSLSGNVPAAHTIAYGASGVDLAEDWNLAMASVEDHGWDITGAIAHPRVKSILRGLRDITNQPIFAENLKDSITTYSVYGIPICFTRKVETSGSPLSSEILMAHFPLVIVGDRYTGIKMKLSQDAVIPSGTDTPIYLYPQDATALRFVLRKGFLIREDDALAKITGVHS
jgi:HK97 family phage major capsid protein